MSPLRQPSAATRPLRVLIVEDRENDLLLLLDELDRAGYEPNYERVQTPTELRQALSADEWEIVVSDFSLPTMTAHDVLEILRREKPDLPCIVISGTITEESAVEVLTAGARDFVVKERMARLIPAIERELREAAERRRLRDSEAALREMRERMQFAVEAVGVGTWESHIPSGRIIWSDVLERLHGFEPGSFAGTLDAFIAAIHPDDREQVLESIANATRDRTDSRIEYRTTWPDGSVHWLMGIGRLFFDENGAPLRAVGVGMDITTQKRLEEQFRQAQKMESIGSLAGGIAHDFNNLLTVISGECEFAGQTISDPSTRESLDAIQSAARSAGALTRQLLTFSRRQIVMPRLIDLNETIQGFSKILRRLVEENVQIEFRLAPALSVVRFDPGQIEQVLLNLVANARDAMPEGGTVTIETCAVAVGDQPCSGHNLPPGSYVKLSVVDTGFGIPPQVRTHLFEPFFTTKPVGRGTGLGLATVHGIVKESGGHIFVDSQQGSGSTFSIYLPVAADPSGTRPADPAGRSAHLDGSETILVVEDNAPLRRLTERVLRTHGYHVLVAANAAQALQICNSHSSAISVLLTDVVMPGDSGPTLAELVLKQRPSAKVVYMSGYTAEKSRVAEHVFVQKPFAATELLLAIRTALGNRTAE